MGGLVWPAFEFAVLSLPWESFTFEFDSEADSRSSSVCFPSVHLISGSGTTGSETCRSRTASSVGLARGVAGVMDIRVAGCRSSLSS